MVREERNNSIQGVKFMENLEKRITWLPQQKQFRQGLEMTLSAKWFCLCPKKQCIKGQRTLAEVNCHLVPESRPRECNENQTYLEAIYIYTVLFSKVGQGCITQIHWKIRKCTKNSPKSPVGSLSENGNALREKHPGKGSHWIYSRQLGTVSLHWGYFPK